MAEKIHSSLREEDVSPQRRKVAIVDVSSAIQPRATDVAEERLTEDREALVGPEFFHGENRTSKEQLRGVGNILKKIWKHNLFYEYYREKEVQKAKRDIVESKNFYVEEGKSREDHNRAMSAVADRFSRELLHADAGEARIELDEGAKESIQRDLRDLFSRYVSGAIDDGAFEEEKTRVINSAIATAGIDRGPVQPLFADNLLDVARNMRANMDHGSRCEMIDFDTDLILGTARLGARTEAQYNAIDRIVDKMQKTKVGRLVNETTLASAVAIAYSVTAGVSKRVAMSEAAAWGTFGATAVVASGLAAARESRRVEAERKHHARTMAVGRTIHENSPRRTEMQGVIYETRDARDLLGRLQNTLYDESGDLKKDLTRSDIDRALGVLAEMNARTRLSDTRSIDLIKYSDIDRVEEERTAFDVARYTAQQDIQKWMAGNPESEAIDVQEALSEREALVSQSLVEGEEGIMEKNRLFKKMKRRRVAGMAAATLLSGIAIGTIGQETAAALGHGKEGLFEGLSGKAPEHVSGTPHMTPLEYLRRLMTDSLPRMEAGHTHITTIADHRYVLPEGVALVKGQGGGFDLVRDGHDILVRDMHPDHAGMFSPKDAGLLHHAHVDLRDGGSVTVQEGTHQSVLDMAREHGVPVKRNIWYDNDTPHVYDHNELKLWWGGAHNTGVDENGDYVFNVAHMTQGGSYHHGLSVDAQRLVAEGKMKLLLSASRSTQRFVSELPVRPNGDIVVDPHSEVGRLFFGVSDGHAQFLGKFAEVAQVAGQHHGVESVNILATYEGHGIQETVPIPHVFHTNIFDVPADYRVDPPPFIPLVPRDPLEKSGPPEPIPPKPIPPEPVPHWTPYEGYGSCGFSPLSQETAETLRDKRMSPRLRENQNVDLDAAKEYEWYRSSWDREHKEKIRGLIDDFGAMDEKCEISVCIPVAAHQEEGNIGRTLEQYASQSLDPSLFELVVFANQPDVDDAGVPVKPDGTFKEIVAFARAHPEINIRVAHRVLPAREAVMGNIRKLMTDAVIDRAARAGNKKVVIVSNDADCRGMSPDYLKNFKEKLLTHSKRESGDAGISETEKTMTSESKPDAMMGQLDWDPALRDKNPVLFSALRFGQFIDAQDRRRTNFVGSSGANFAFLSDMYAAIGGYGGEERIGEDVSLGRFIRAARYGYPDRGIHFGGARASRLYTSARRGIEAIKKGFHFGSMWSELPFTANDELRKMDDGAMPEQTFDFSRDKQRKEFTKKLEEAINVSLSSRASLYRSSLYQPKGSVARALNWLGVKYVFVHGYGVRITNADRLMAFLSKKTSDAEYEKAA